MTSIVLSAGRGIRSIDRVVLAIIAVLLVLALFTPAQALTSVEFAFWQPKPTSTRRILLSRHQMNIFRPPANLAE